MSTILILFALGVFMLSLEIFLPGGIVGILGGIVLLVAAYLGFRDFGAGGGALALLVAGALAAGAFYVELVILPRTRLGRGMLLSAEVTGKATRPSDASLVGRPCQAATVLAPSGFVLVDGRRLEAFCRDGYAESGAALVIHGSDNFRLIVSKTS